ncbi:unnamed protein product [Caretta caretta]
MPCSQQPNSSAIRNSPSVLPPSSQPASSHLFGGWGRDRGHQPEPTLSKPEGRKILDSVFSFCCLHACLKMVPICSPENKASSTEAPWRGGPSMPAEGRSQIRPKKKRTREEMFYELIQSSAVTDRDHRG